jgi:hypothetical protein
VSSFKRIRCTEWILHFLHLGYHGNVCHFEHQNTKILWFGQNFVSKLSGSSSCKLIIVIVFGIGSSHFEKNQPLKAQLHMAYDITTRFHKVWSRHLREIEQTKMCGRIRIISQMKFVRHIVFALFLIIIIIIITSPWLLSGDVFDDRNKKFV